MAELFHPQVALIEAIPKRVGWVRIRLTTGQTIDMTEARVVGLTIRKGREWTIERAAEAENGAEVDRLKEIARKYLARAARSRSQVEERLMRDDADPKMVQVALDELEAAGLIDDRAFARGVVSTGTDRGPGRRYVLERKLAVAGVSHEIVTEALAQLGPDAEADARALVQSRLGKCSPGQSRVKTAVRMARLLASRGFDEDTAIEAIEAVMGTIDDDETEM